MTMLEELKSLGVDVDDGLKRVMGKEKLYIKLFGTFVKTIEGQIVRPDFDISECEETIEKVHSIKGTSGNLSITPIYEAYTQILNQLRGGEIEAARAGIRNVLPIQEEIVNCIKKHME